MKREKIIFALFVMPIFLFSANLKHWKLDRGKNPSFGLLPKKIISQEKSGPAQFQGPNNLLDQSSPRKKPDSSRMGKGVTGKAYPFQNTGSIARGRKRNFRPGRTNRPESSLVRHRIKHMNKGLPFSYDGPLYRPDEILVKFKPTLSEQTIEATIASYQGRKIKRIPRINVYSLKIQEGTTVEETLFALRRNPDVEYAEPNYIVSIAETPNDPLFDYQYALYNRGQDIGPPGSPQGQDRADIDATSTWEETKGIEDILIAILDTGVDMLHPDLDEKIHSSGYDFVNGDSDATDDHSHGTNMAGIAAAETDNSEGTAGVAWNCKVLPVKVLDDLGFGDTDDLADGIIWAADHGADVINLSLGLAVPVITLENALRYAHDLDVVIVAAAGNTGDAVLYPAAYDDYCLAVAATDYNDERVDFSNSGGLWESNFGPEIDVAGPGARIIGPVPTWFWGPDSFPYAWGDGTSQAAAHIAGIAALIKSIKPNLSADQIMKVICYSADDVNFVNNLGFDNFLGWGRANAKKAIVPTVIEASK